MYIYIVYIYINICICTIYIYIYIYIMIISYPVEKKENALIIIHSAMEIRKCNINRIILLLSLLAKLSLPTSLRARYPSV